MPSFYEVLNKGAIEILDSRLLTKVYDKDFVNSLPRTCITSELKNVAQIFEDERRLIDKSKGYEY